MSLVRLTIQRYSVCNYYHPRPTFFNKKIPMKKPIAIRVTKKILRAKFLLALGLAIGPNRLHAQTTFHWLNTNGGSYHTASNWTPAGGPPIFDDSARFGLSTPYTVTFSNAGTQTKNFQVSNGNVTFAFLNPTAVHNWVSGNTNFVGPLAGDANSNATLNLTSMFHNPMRGGDLVVGRAAGKTGTLNLSGNGNWEGWVNSNVFVGQAGTGNLNISTTGILQKSSLKSDSIVVGAGGTGNATVSGFNASLVANNFLTVGAADSTGNLLISNQGKASVGQSLWIGVQSDSNNQITVTGSGSELVLGNSQTSIGFEGGKGTLNVLSGATVTNSGSSVEIGDSFGSTGSLNISGSGSQFISADDSVMKIGNGGLGFVDVEAGGKLTVSQIDVGSISSPSSQGSLSVSGMGSRVDLTGTQMNYVGNNSGGYLSLSSGSVLDSQGTMVVGNMRLGELQVLSGSQLFSTGGIVGLGVAGLNNTMPSTVSVSGTGSLWSMSENLVVGSHRFAEVQIGSGGKIISSGGILGQHVGSTGNLSLSGNNSLWDSNGTVIVGGAGDGRLSVSNGAQVVSNGPVRVGVTQTGIGELRVFENGAQLDVSGGNLVLGSFGQGDLKVTSGGKVNLGAGSNAFLGETPSGTGTMQVSGSGSEFNYSSTSHLQVGRQGTGSLQISQGGVVNGGNGSIGSFVQLGSAVGSQGSVKVQNSGSKWNLSDNLVVGGAGTGTLEILQGGQVNAGQLEVATGFGSQGDIQLLSAGSQLTISQNANVGGSANAEGGVGNLNISSGTTASVGGQLTLWSQGTVTLNHGTLKLGSLNDQGGQLQWNSGKVQFNQNTVLTNSLLDSLVGTSQSLSNNQTLEVADGKTLIVGHNTDFAVDGGRVRAANFTNAGFTTLQKGSIEVSGNFFNDVGGNFVLQNMRQSAGGLFTNNGLVTGHGRLQHQLQNNGTVAVNSESHLINDNGSSMSTNSNQIQLAGGRLDVTGALTNATGAFITGHGVLGTSAGTPGNLGLINNGTIAVSGSAMDIHGDVRNLAGGRIQTSGNSTTTFWDDVEHNGSEIRTSAGSSTVFYGSVTGAAPYTGTGSVFFEGDLKPGNSPADVQFEGDVHFGELALLSIEIGGLAAGLDYDRLTVDGSTWLDGFLSVDLVSNFSPQVGDSFTIIRNRGTDPLFGQFIGLDQGASLFAGNHQFSVDYFGGNGHDFVLSVVPEPSAAILLAVAVMGCGLLRRRPPAN